LDGTTLYFTKKHEWVSVVGNMGTVGITDYAQQALCKQYLHWTNYALPVILMIAVEIPQPEKVYKIPKNYFQVMLSMRSCLMLIQKLQ
jgi:hypothetical protein